MNQLVSITGVGVVSAFGTSRDGFRDALLSGRTGVAPVEAFRAMGCRSTLAARVAEFEPARWISPMKLRRMDDTGPMALVAVRQAMEDARFAPDAAGEDRVGVVLGTATAGGQATFEYLSALFRGGPTGAPALLFNSTVANAAAGLVGLEYGLRGPNTTISHKEASGLAAIVTAVDLLRDGRADAVAAGGVDAIYDVFYRTHDRFRTMSEASSADGAAVPFGRCRSGWVMGEGGFALWLERGDDWGARGARRHGSILGVGAAATSVPVNAWPVDRRALVRTMEIALEDAGLGPEDVDVVFASANGTRAFDCVEGGALTELFGGRRTVVTSIKGALGEFGASGVASCVAALVCSGVESVPPIAGLKEGDGAAAALRLARTALPLPGPVGLVNSFASGGALFSVVLRLAG